MKKLQMVTVCSIILFVFMGCSMYTTQSIDNTNNESNILVFTSFKQFNSDMSELSNSGVGTRGGLSKFSGFTSFLDEIPDINDFSSKEEFEQYISTHSGAFAENEIESSDGEIKKVFTLTVNPLLAAAINGDGEINVEAQVYNLFDESERDDFIAKCLSNNDSNSRLIFDIPDWSTTGVPMWHGATSSPTYSVKDFKTKIGGRQTVVQLWKGYCPAIAGAGGVGAEIGLYQNPPWWASAIWWPDYKHPRNIDYDLVYKNNGTSYLKKSGNTWWLNTWRVYESSPSLMGNDYTLKYTIEGVARSW